MQSGSRAKIRVVVPVYLLLGFIGIWIANAAAKPIPEQAARQPVSALDFEVYRTRVEPIFLKQPLLFAPNGLKLSAPSRKALKCAAAWLRQHRESQLLIVGYCDASGSENCTAAFERRRGETVRQFLASLGAPPDQIAEVKGWDSLDQTCRVDTAMCQRLNRSVRLFVKGSAGMGVEPKEVK